MPSLREDLETACANVRRQIEVQQQSWAYDGFNNRDRRNGLVAELQAELSELETALANLDPRET